MSSPLVTQFRRGGVSKDVRLTAATGALPLSPADQIELLFLLSRDRDDAVSAQASTSLQAMDEASLISVLKEVSTPADVLAFFGTRSVSDDVQQSLVRNATTPDQTILAMVPTLTESNLEFVVVNQTRLLRHGPLVKALEEQVNLSSDQRRRIEELKQFLIESDDPRPFVAALCAARDLPSPAKIEYGQLSLAGSGNRKSSGMTSMEADAVVTAIITRRSPLTLIKAFQVAWSKAANSTAAKISGDM